MSHPCPVDPPCGQCRFCVRYRDDPVFRERWDARERGEILPQVERPKAKGQEPCIHLGEPTGERQVCDTCSGKVEIKLMACDVYGKCTTYKKLDGVACCIGCPTYQAVTLYRAS